jgi:hypothetical protein
MAVSPWLSEFAASYSPRDTMAAATDPASEVSLESELETDLRRPLPFADNK